jgi:diadenosine tetraphosphate (Ap4A) HIT family hydrolase
MPEIDPAFLTGSHALDELPLCHVRLQDDARWPWLILIPQVSGAREIEDLTVAERRLLLEEVVAAGNAVRVLGAALGLAVEKLNVGALGNVTPQLHVHVVGRWAGDPAWPGPVWGFGEAERLAPEVLKRALDAARPALAPGAQPYPPFPGRGPA